MTSWLHIWIFLFFYSNIIKDKNKKKEKIKCLVKNDDDEEIPPLNNWSTLFSSLDTCFIDSSAKVSSFKSITWFLLSLFWNSISPSAVSCFIVSVLTEHLADWFKEASFALIVSSWIE